MHHVHGQTLGQVLHQQSFAAFALAEMQPTVPADAVAVHTHEEAQAILLLDGCYVSDALGMPKLCVEPCLILNPPGTTHRDHFAALQGRFVAISFSTSFWLSLTDSWREMPTAIRAQPRAFACAMRAWHALRSPDLESDLSVQNELLLMLSEVMAPKKPSNLTLASTSAWLERAAEWLRDEHDHAHCIADLARVAQLHPVYFARAFRARFGCSPSDYQRLFRLQRALPILRDRRVALAEIAMRHGFTDQSHFHRHFRHAFGFTPAQYRRVANVQDRSATGS